MPIKSITTKEARFSQQIGKLFKGGERPPNGKAPGRNTDKFRFALAEGYENLASVLVELFGEQPTQFIDIRILGDTPAQVFPNWMESYRANGLIRRCDGEQQVKYLTDAGDYGFTPIACLGDKCDCKPVGRLKIVFPQLQQATGVIGFFTLATHSWNDVDHLWQFFNGLYAMGNQKPLSQYTYTLFRENRLISTPGKDGTKGKRNESLLALRAFDRGEVIPTQAAPETDEDDVIEINTRPFQPEQLYMYIAGLVNDSEKPDTPLTADQIKGTIQLFNLCEIETGLALALLEYLFEVYPAPNTTGIPFALLNQRQGEALHKWLKNKDEWHNIKAELATFEREYLSSNEIPF